MLDAPATSGAALVLLAAALGACTMPERVSPDTNDVYYCRTRTARKGYALEIEALKTRLEVTNVEVWQSTRVRTKDGKQTRIKTAVDDSLTKDLIRVDVGRPFRWEGALTTVHPVQGGIPVLLASGDLKFPDDKTIQTPDNAKERARNRWKWEMICWDQ